MPLGISVASQERFRVIGSLVCMWKLLVRGYAALRYSVDAGSSCPCKAARNVCQARVAHFTLTAKRVISFCFVVCRTQRAEIARGFAVLQDHVLIKFAQVSHYAKTSCTL